MNPYASTQTDSVTLVKQDGRRLGPYKTSIAQTVTIFVDHLDAEEGDHLERQIPGGKIEIHHILDCTYSAAVLGVGPYWSLKLRKGPEKARPVTAQNTYHIHNSQNIQIGDHNTQQIEQGIAELLKRIEASGAPKEDVDIAKGQVAKMLEHPLISGVLGSAVGALIGLAGA